jgi:hypothetical protein
LGRKSVLKNIKRFGRSVTSGMRVLPDFIVIGATRSGTTSLYENLTRHPSVVPCATKEPSFFNLHFERGVGWYRSQFPLSLHKRYFEDVLRMRFATGEASANYFYYPSVPEKISRILPQVKLILLLRNPVNRAYSDYQLSVRSHKETRSFKEAVENEINDSVVLTQDNELSVLRLRYLLKGTYADHLERWLRFFTNQDLLILESEDFFLNQSGAFKRVVEHLGLPLWEPRDFVAYSAPGKRRSDSAGGKVLREFDPDFRKVLVEYFRPYNQKLYQMLGKDLGWDR